MALKDKTKWDKKYKDTPSLLQKRDPSKKLTNIINIPSGNKALDIACGTGRNSIYLANSGYSVDALDISQVALEVLNNQNIKNLTTKLIDLDDYEPDTNCYDLIVMCNYLQREIIPKLASSLKKDGVLLIETYMDHPSNTKPNSNPDFFLKKDELKSFFPDNSNYKILDYEEFDNEPHELYRMRKQAITVRKL